MAPLITLALVLLAQDDPLLQWMDRVAQRQLDERERAIAAIQTREQAEQRQSLVRQELLRVLGGLPTHRGPLKAKVTGTLTRNGYVIEKVIFESLPGLLVTGNLYRPAKAGKHPAVLIPAGHTQEGKPEMQVLAANLALQGFVALTYDPIGQGEREQTYLPQLGRALSGGGGNEHLELGARSLLLGQSVARYFIHDGVRALDYLVSRSDVDAARLGVAGCSGGGAITTYLGALEPRLKAASPGCHINSFRTLFTGPTPDSEMSLPSFLATGLDLADFYEVSAPLPWLLLATEGDYFTPAGAKPVYEEVRRWYGIYGAEERVRHFVGSGPHGTPKESREEIYRWMNRWLGGKGDSLDRPVELLTNLELQVTPSGNVDGEPGSRKVYQVIRDEFYAIRQRKPTQDLKAELERWGVRKNGREISFRLRGQASTLDYRMQEIAFESEPGVTLTGKLYFPPKTGRKAAVVVVEELRRPVPLYVQRSQATTSIVEALVKAGHVVLEFEPRDAPSAYDGRPFLGNWLTNERADLIGKNLAAMRAQDILAAVELLATHAEVDATRIGGYARGAKGFWLMMAATADERLKRIWLDRMSANLAGAFEEPLTNQLFEVTVPGLARHWDYDDFVKLIGTPRIFWTDPTNWMNRVVKLAGPYRYRTVGEGDGLSAEAFALR